MGVKQECSQLVDEYDIPLEPLLYDESIQIVLCISLQAAYLTWGVSWNIVLSIVLGYRFLFLFFNF